MKTLSFVRRGVLVAALACVASLASADGAPAGPAKPKTVTLETRKAGPYGKAAYSFRQASQDVGVHKNYVDLLLNKCGLLHVNMYNSAASRICDLGEKKLDEAPEAPADAKWLEQSVKPEAGHTYLLEIADQRQKMTVVFRVESVDAGAVKLTWLPVKPLEGPARGPRDGAAGTHGQCGGDHPVK